LSVALAISIATGISGMPAAAEVAQTDLLIAGRAIGFIRSLKSGDVHVGIVYDPGIAQSVQQAADLNGLMGGSLSVGNLVLKPVMLPVAQLGNAGIDLFFLTEGMGIDGEKVKAASRARKIPCITFDMTQVRNGACAMGVRSQPKIEVFVNREAAEASGTDLATVFRVMITEI
jgi:ABC-type uncharacterized transport system substrate-binding protein